jgi:hypothetical protein
LKLLLSTEPTILLVCDVHSNKQAGMVPPHIELAKTMSQQRLEMITELKAAFQALTSDLISQGKQANGKSMDSGHVTGSLARVT